MVDFARSVSGNPKAGQGRIVMRGSAALMRTYGRDVLPSEHVESSVVSTMPPLSAQP